jgi:hypothetical protein
MNPSRFNGCFDMKPSEIKEKMWAALEKYQPCADADGHGKSWSRMCEFKTNRAFADASAPLPVSYAYFAISAAAAVLNSYYATTYSHNAHVQLAIDYINYAISNKEIKMTKLDEMWVALEKYQDKADKRGHGVTWAKMCELKTTEAANAARVAASAVNAVNWAAAAAAAASNASFIQAFSKIGLVPDAYAADRADRWAQKAIEDINKALGETE